MVLESGAKYSKLPSADERVSHALKQPRAPRSRRWLTVSLVLFCGLCGYMAIYLRPRWGGLNLGCGDTIDHGYQCAPDISRHWGQYSPYFSVPESEYASSVPDTCEITFVNLLSRHGARYPSPRKSRRYDATVSRIQANIPAGAFQGKYSFLNNYKYRLGAADLVGFGHQQMINSGIKFFRRYSKLAADNTPFVRTASKQRVIDSADSWSRGFHSAKSATNEDDEFPYGRVVLWEGEEFNNTLDHSRCDELEHGALSKLGHTAQQEFVRVFTPPIMGRLNRDLPSTDITPKDVINLMQMCPFDTVADPQGVPSPFCGLFSVEEFRQLSWYETLDKFYQFGTGNPLGPTQGVGFVNELLARMTRTPVKDGTTTNSTLDGDKKTFPLDRVLYADFSHDNDLTSIFSALGLYDDTPMLPKTRVMDEEDTAGFSASWVVPFGSRAYFEKMRCSDAGEGEELVRAIINDRVVPLKGCGADDLGRCTLSRFVESQSFSRSNGDWDKCFVS